jgi:hypothetical protein
MTSWAGRLARRGRLWAGFRSREPVVVIESDDWGLRRRPCADEVARWGTPSPWADEHAETAEDLARLVEVLDRHVDDVGRSPSFTMNVIAANPDHAAIEADGFARYHDRPLDRTLDPAVLAAFADGVAGGRLCLQLHGRAHADVERWLADLRDDVPGARDLFAAGADGGLSLVKEHGGRYHSEYVPLGRGAPRPTAELVDWLRPAMATIERIGGTRSRSAVAPHYVLTDEAEAAWAELGLEFVQSAERRLRPDGTAISYLGQSAPSGLTHLTRTVRFDPRPGRRHDGKAAILRMQRCVEVGLPAVIDAHRINFTGPWAEAATEQLDTLLDAADAVGARYLTTPELGEAVRDDGAYRDVVHDEDRHLTPAGRTSRRVARPLIGHR